MSTVIMIVWQDLQSYQKWEQVFTFTQDSFSILVLVKLVFGICAQIMFMYSKKQKQLAWIIAYKKFNFHRR